MIVSEGHIYSIKSLELMFEEAKKDDCLRGMVPSDMRNILGSHLRACEELEKLRKVTSEHLTSKKRWRPCRLETYFFIDQDFCVDSCIWHEHAIDQSRLNIFGVFKTESEALAMRDKIREFVTQHLGIV